MIEYGGKEAIEVHKKMLKRIGIVAVALLLLIYLGFQIYSTTYSQIKTETASYVAVNETISATGFVVRKETVLTNEASGVLRSEERRVGKSVHG